MKLLKKLKVSKAMLAVMLVGIIIPMTMVVAFANDGGESISIDYSSIFNEDLFTPLLEGIMSNVEPLLIVCIVLLSLYVVPNLILLILDKFFGIFYAAGSFWKWGEDDDVELWSLHK